MSSINVPGQACVANVQKNFFAHTLPGTITDVRVKLTDPNSLWSTAVGNIKQWGIQKQQAGVNITAITNLVNPTITCAVDISQLFQVGDLVSIDNVTFAGPVVRGSDQLLVLAKPTSTSFQVQLGVAPGVYQSGGQIWTWKFFQKNIPFGLLDRHGAFNVALDATAADMGAAGDLLRLAVLTDAAITLGAAITTTP